MSSMQETSFLEGGKGLHGSHAQVWYVFSLPRDLATEGGKAVWVILFVCATVLIILKILDNEPYRLASA